MDKVAAVESVMHAYGEYRKSRILVTLANGEKNISSAFEIEYAMDHLLSGLSQDDEAVREANVKKALSHIYRGTLDNLKYVIARKNQLVTEILKTKNADVLLEPKVRDYLYKIKHAQERIFGGEGLSVDEIYAILGGLVDDVEVLEMLNQDYLVAKKRSFRREVYVTFMAFALGILASLIASTIANVWKLP